MRENKKEYIVTTICPFCGHAHEIAVSEADYWDWQDGALVQDAFPYLTTDEREMLISGICPTCWERALGVPDEDDEDDEDFEDWEDIAEEYGYNPYMGCYDFDC